MMMITREGPWIPSLVSDANNGMGFFLISTKI